MPSNFLKDRLNKTREALFGRIKKLFAGKDLAEELLPEAQEILLTSDVSIKATKELLKGAFENERVENREHFFEMLKKRMVALLEKGNAAEVKMSNEKPLSVMVVGVNGVGKTTTIGKMAKARVKNGENGILAACDTFRAAAIEQLEVWGEKTGCRVIKQKAQADPASVAFDSLKAAIAGNHDFLILDTAGRLHTKFNLMEELKKIKRVLGKENSAHPKDVLLVLDATLGQNNINQVKEFHETLGLTGIVMTKMDGTAKGGTLLSLATEYAIPIKYIGVGEGEDDLIPFSAVDFVDAIFS